MSIAHFSAPWPLLLVLLALPVNGAALLPMIDAHAHYTLPDAQRFPPPEIMSKLDTAGVSRLAVTSQPPDLAQHLYRHAPTRILPLLGVYQFDLSKSGWLHDDTLPARVEAQLAQGEWAGIGELHLFAPDARNPVFEAIVKLAEANHKVLMLHADAAVIDHAFAIAPRVRILWAHLGTDPRPEVLAPRLQRHPHLWIDTSVRDERIAPDDQLRPEWHALITSYPERFVVAVDTFSTRRWSNYGEVVRTIRRWVDTLPPALQAKLLHDNAAELFEGFSATGATP